MRQRLFGKLSIDRVVLGWHWDFWRREQQGWVGGFWVPDRYVSCFWCGPLEVEVWHT